MANTLIIIPAYNEQDNIARLLEALIALPLSLDILVVDDGNDNTSAIIKEIQSRQPNVFLMKREGKQGRGSAVLAGIAYGLQRDYEYLVEMDADFSHDPAELPRLMSHADTDRVVIGSRYVEGSRIENWPLKRRVFSWLANRYADLILGVGLNDYTNGYRVYGRKAIQQLDASKIRATGYIVLSEISYQLFRKGVPFTECHIVFVNRSRGGSNLSLKEIIEAFTSVWKIKKANSKS